MSRIVYKGQYRVNRKKVFEHGDLRLWLNTGGAKPVKGAILELMRKRPGAGSKWDLFWTGVVRIEEWRATVETKSLGIDKAK